MGPIERELRGYPKDNVGHWTAPSNGGGLSWSAFDVLRDAADSLGIDGDSCGAVEARMPEVLSEAIEAAEALGL